MHEQQTKPHVPDRLPSYMAGAFVVLTFAAVLSMSVASGIEAERKGAEAESAVITHVPIPVVDKEAYAKKMRALAHLSEEPEPQTEGEDATGGSPLWPADAPVPNDGAILPFKRIVAYYGNFYAKGMGVLGEYPEDVMLEKFRGEIKKWNDADPTTPVMPAVDYIAVTAQLSPGKDGKHRARMPFDQIDKALAVAEKVNGIVILEVQAGLADIMGEVKLLEPYLLNPKVHLAIDPEFAMKTGARPGTVVGTVDAKEMNAVAEYLAGLVRANDLTPKVLIIHRYTKAMVTNATKIQPLPEVQIVMDMDGWGPKAKKYSTYNSYIKTEPVQFTGFKLFYKNDIKQPGTVLLTPKELLEELTPQPSFIQFQ